MTGLKRTELEWDKYIDYLKEAINESKAMRRAEEKPMSTPKGAAEPHVTSRSVHSRMAADVAKRIANGLELNGEYIYTAMLMHDLGHPFSAHEGEEIFNTIGQRKNCGFFHHNAKGVEIVQAEGIMEKAIEKIPNIGNNPVLRKKLEEEFYYFYDVIISHDGEATRRERNKKETEYPSMQEAVKQKLRQANSHNNYKFVAQTPEGKIAKMADVIAYVATDIRDGFRIGIINGFSENYLALLGEMFTTEFTDRQGYIANGRRLLNEIQSRKLRELDKDMRTQENQEVLKMANKIIERCRAQGIDIFSMDETEMEKLSIVIDETIETIRKQSKNKSYEERQFANADIQKLKEFVGKLIRINSDTVDSITARMQDYFITDILNETREESIDKDNRINYLREQLRKEPDNITLQKQLEEEGRSTIDVKFSQKAERLFDFIRQLNYQEIVQYTKWDYQIDAQPKAAKRLVEIAARSLQNTGAIRNKFYDRSIRKQIEPEALRYMNTSEIDEEQYEDEKKRIGLRSIRNNTHIQCPVEKYSASSEERRKKQFFREVYNFSQKQGSNFATRYNNAFAAIPTTVRKNVEQALEYDETFTNKVREIRRKMLEKYDNDYEKARLHKQEFIDELIGQEYGTLEEITRILERALQPSTYLDEYEEQENKKIQEEILRQYKSIEEARTHIEEIISTRIEEARANMEEIVANQLAIDYISGMTDRSFNDLATKMGYMAHDHFTAKRTKQPSSSVVGLIKKNNQELQEEENER